MVSHNSSRLSTLSDILHIPFSSIQVALKTLEFNFTYGRSSYLAAKSSKYCCISEELA
jgi:hypothetical protein